MRTCVAPYKHEWRLLESRWRRIVGSGDKTVEYEYKYYCIHCRTIVTDKAKEI